MDSEWSWYLLILTETAHSLDWVSISIVLDTPRAQSTGRAWHLNKQHGQSQDEKKLLKEAATQGQHSRASVFKSH